MEKIKRTWTQRELKNLGLSGTARKLVQLEDLTMEYYYHNTCVARYSPITEALSLSGGDYYSLTTSRAMQQALDCFYNCGAKPRNNPVLKVKGSAGEYFVAYDTETAHVTRWVEALEINCMDFKKSRLRFPHDRTGSSLVDERTGEVR